jgi:TRAP-type C4-dicarboxylate transport system substrate-binding protein
VGWPRAGKAAGTTFDLDEVLPEANWQTVVVKQFAAAVEKATNGSIVINVHSGGALGFKGPDHLDAIANGLIPMTDLLLAQAVGEVPIFKLESLPFLVKSPDELKVLHKYLRPKLDEAAAKHNQKFLTYMPSPMNAIYAKVKADDLAGLKNVKCRGADMTSVETFDAIGMTGVQIPWGELIPALATGRVDAVGTSATSAVDGKFWEFLKFIYPTNHIWASNCVSINLDAWNKLSADDQKAMLAVSAEQEPKFWAASKQQGDAAMEMLRKNGMAVVDMPDAMFAEMQKATKPMIDKYVAEVPEAGPIIEAYLKDVGRA